MFSMVVPCVDGKLQRHAVGLGQLPLQPLNGMISGRDEQAAEIGDRRAVIELKGTVQKPAPSARTDCSAAVRGHSASELEQLRPPRCPGVAKETPVPGDVQQRGRQRRRAAAPPVSSAASRSGRDGSIGRLRLSRCGSGWACSSSTPPLGRRRPCPTAPPRDRHGEFGTSAQFLESAATCRLAAQSFVRPEPMSQMRRPTPGGDVRGRWCRAACRGR